MVYAAKGQWERKELKAEAREQAKHGKKYYYYYLPYAGLSFCSFCVRDGLNFFLSLATTYYGQGFT